jgi:hypothetical protein
VRYIRWQVITTATQASPSVQPTRTSVSKWYPRKTRLSPMATNQTTARTTDKIRAINDVRCSRRR